MRARLTAFVLGLLVVLCLWSGGSRPAAAQSILQGGTIDEIVVQGTQRIEAQTVLSYMTVGPGDSFDPAKLNESLKQLFETGLFADVTLRREGDDLIVQVVENPIINRIAFEGNDSLDNESLRDEVELRPRVVYTRTKVQNDVRRLLELYRRNGRFAATVEPKVIQLEQNRVDLVFEIDEGPKTGVKAINFVGNKAFSDGTLRGEIATTESAFWRILTSNDTYDPDRLTFDRELLRRFYLSEGYADFQVESAVAELTPDREGFIITFTVDEGERYRFSAIDIESSLKNLDPEVLRQHLETEEGDWYDAEAVEDTIENLTDEVGNLGFAFVEVKPRVTRDRENLTIDLTYEIQEGPKVFVERIDIEGNVRTLDRVIRREFRLVEGDAFNAAKLRRSRERIQNLGFFRTVEMSTAEGSAPDKTVVTVEVEEQSTGNLSFGAGFSTQAGLLGTVGIRERNLLGRGQDLRLNLTLSGDRSQIDLSFTEPYFLERNLSAGFDLFRTVTERDESSFDDERIGGSLRAGYALTEFWRQSWRYTLERREISDVGSPSLAIQQSEGTSVRSSVTHQVSYDTRDNRFDPHEGVNLFTENTVAGVGGGVRFVKNRVGADYFYPVTDTWTIGLLGEGGHIFGIGEDTRILDRFLIGGSGSLRGFQFAGVGPRDAQTNDALGAKQFYTASLELRFPLGLPEELDVRGRVFADVGSAWGVDNAPGGVLDDSSPRVSVGTGFTWNSPLGPLDIDVGFPLVKEDFDETEILQFSFGTRF